jgi:cupin-like protein
MLDKTAFQFDQENETRWIATRSSEATENFNRHSFEVLHRLSSHPLLQLPKLLELAERTVTSRPQDLYFDMGNVRTGQRWDEIQEAKFSAVEAMKQLESSDAWFLFRHAQNDPQYKELFERGLREIKEIAGQEVDGLIRQQDILIFVASPNRVTPYHIDRECNFLLQISGTKTLHVFDREDQDVLPNEEIERFWAVDNNAPVYRPQYQDRAIPYRMKPGTGVHIPVNFPHWVQNDNNISVSLSVNFQFLDSVRANLYRTNYYLRKMGVTPSEPGLHSGRDAAKTFAMTCALAARRIVRGGHRGDRIWN